MFSSCVAAEDELELGRRDELADDVDDVVAHDALGGAEVADAHADDPPVDLAERRLIAPLLEVALHRHVLGLPVVGLHRAVELVGPAVTQRQEVERHRLAAADDALRCERVLRLRAIEDEGPGSDRVRVLHVRSFPSRGGRRARCAGRATHRRAALLPRTSPVVSREGQSTGLVPRESRGPYRCGTAPGSDRTSLTTTPPVCRGRRSMQTGPDGRALERGSPW